MVPELYESIPLRINVLKWPDASIREIERMIGASHIREFNGGIQVENKDGKWEVLHDGSSVTITDNNDIFIMSPGYFSLNYRKVNQ